MLLGKFSLMILGLIINVMAQNEEMNLLRQIQLSLHDIRREQNDYLDKYVQLLGQNHKQQESVRKEIMTLRDNMINLYQVVEDLKTDLRQQGKEVREMIEIRKEKYEQTEKILKNMEKYNEKRLSDLTHRTDLVQQLTGKTLALLNSGQIKVGGNQAMEGNFEEFFSKTVTESVSVNLMTFKTTTLNPEFESIKDLVKIGVEEIKDSIFQIKPNCEDHSEEMKIILEKSFKNLTELMDKKLGENLKIPREITPEKPQVPDEIIPEGEERNLFLGGIIQPSTTTEPAPCNRLSFAHEPRNCAELRKDGVTCNGVYPVYLNPDSSQQRFVSCDMTTDGGGWTVITRRDDYGDKKTNFDKTWKVYKEGFGNTRKDFWFGNNNLHRITSQEKNELRVELTSFGGEFLSLTYKEFHIGNSTSKFMLKIGDILEGGDHPIFGQSLKNHDGHAFSTKDENYSGNDVDCATKYKAGWWYKSDECFETIVTAPYFKEGEYRDEKEGIIWKSWKDWQLLKSVEMKVRPINFDPNME